MAQDMSLLTGSHFRGTHVLKNCLENCPDLLCIVPKGKVDKNEDRHRITSNILIDSVPHRIWYI